MGPRAKELLQKAIADLHLEPGQTHETVVGDCYVRIHRHAEPEVSPSIIVDANQSDRAAKLAQPGDVSIPVRGR